MGKWVHKLSEIDEETRTGICANCGPVRVKSAGRGRGWRCRVASRAYRGDTASSIRRPHGLTTAQAREFRQGNVCEICGSAEGLCVDHDHASKAIRGVLCRKCNTGLGMFADDPDLMARAAEYVSKRTPAQQA